MIALDTLTKIGKSPKRQKDEESNVEEDSDNDDESGNENDEENEVNDEQEESDNADESNDDNDDGDDESNDDDDDDDDAKEESDNDDEENHNADDADDENMQSDDDDDESKKTGNAGWADVMQKILKATKPKKKKTLVLSRAKKISEIVPKIIDDKATVDVVDTDGKIKKVIKDEKNVKTIAVPVVENKLKRKKKDPNLTARVKPSVLDRDREKTLQKIATKGVVQLFNAVKQQQAEIQNKLVDAGPIERKREKVLKNIDKNAFLDVLMGGTKSIKVDDKQVAAKKEEIVEKKAENVWSVLRDDFAMGANLKDWDKNAPEDDDDSSAPEAMDSD
ncbi:hypothetical protein HCN44_009547 [Aphidius gifuensis]|uniref:RRP15-like protein n=1 Tax=Aphidius gifuensis TaxID=684658 RepID=A0A835CWA4_APHGI|nr:hypothetical protein HCN44_009547 [Aphidius gifuensis]